MSASRWAAFASIPDRSTTWSKTSSSAIAAIFPKMVLCCPIIAINKHTGKSEGLPEIVSRGFVGQRRLGHPAGGARNVVAKTLENSTAEERGDWGVMQEKIRTDLKRFLD